MSYRPYKAIIDSALELVDKATVIYTNNTPNTILAFTPVMINGSGEIQVVDVADPTLPNSTIGVALENISPGNDGKILISGRIENVSLSFPHGAILYVSKTGTLTNSVPTIGINGFVSGDSVVRIGGIVRNRSNPTLKDLILTISHVGKL